MSNRFARWVGLAALLTVHTSCGERGETMRDAGASVVADAGIGAWHPFFVLIAFTRATPVPRTPAQQVQDSTLVARGYLEDVMDGRVVDFATGASNPVYTAVFRIRIETEVKGEGEEHAYAEFMRGGIPIERMRELLPRDVPMVFLLREPGWDPETYVFEHAGRGLPSGASLHAFNYPSGIALEGEDGIDYPLADVPFDKIFEAGDLDALVEELRALAR